MISKLKTPAALAAILAVALVAVVAAWAVSEGFDDDDDDVTTVTAAAAEVASTGDVDEAPAAAEPALAPEDEPLGAAELERVEAAAIKAAGGGQVAEVDRSDDVGEAYEVEVLTDAGEVDVALDEQLRQVPNVRYDD